MDELMIMDEQSDRGGGGGGCSGWCGGDEEKMGQKCMPNNTPTITSEKCAMATNSQRVFVVTMFVHML